MYFTKANFMKKCKQMKAACLTEASKIHILLYFGENAFLL